MKTAWLRYQLHSHVNLRFSVHVSIPTAYVLQLVHTTTRNRVNHEVWLHWLRYWSFSDVNLKMQSDKPKKSRSHLYKIVFLFKGSFPPTVVLMPQLVQVHFRHTVQLIIWVHFCCTDLFTHQSSPVTSEVWCKKMWQTRISWTVPTKTPIGSQTILLQRSALQFGLLPILHSICISRTKRKNSFGNLGSSHMSCLTSASTAPEWSEQFNKRLKQRTCWHWIWPTLSVAPLISNIVRLPSLSSSSSHHPHLPTRIVSWGPVWMHWRPVHSAGKSTSLRSDGELWRLTLRAPLYVLS